MSDHKEIDSHSGVETTGHEWDGLKELNNPAPRWWLWVFFVTIIWAIGYWVVYPAWPTLSGNTKGIAGWTQYEKLKHEQAEIITRRGEMASKIKTHTLQEIQQDPELYAFAIAGGNVMFKENCAACHGTGAAGGKGYPNLNDDDWIWGGDVESIYHTLKVGIRATHDDTLFSQMPAYGDLLSRDEMASVADHVMSLSAKSDPSEQGAAIFKQHCASCHGESGKGNREFGAPNLSDAIWLYGSDKASVIQQMIAPRHGMMPNWDTRLPDETLKSLAIYVHSLGGGEALKPKE